MRLELAYGSSRMAHLKHEIDKFSVAFVGEGCGSDTNLLAESEPRFDFDFAVFDELEKNIVRDGVAQAELAWKRCFTLNPGPSSSLEA